MSPTRSALEKAVTLLARRDYSAHELRRKLAPSHPQEEIEQALERLSKQGLLDDERVAMDRARMRRLRQYWGDLRLRRDLAHLGIDDRIAERALEAVNHILSEAESLDRLANRWVKTHGEPSSLREMKRLFDYCLRRGYTPDLVHSKLEIWWERLRAT